jgi:23S rRNA (uracil1939-C5)-methyltransferase
LSRRKAKDPRAVGTRHLVQVEAMDGAATATARDLDGLRFRVPFGVPGDTVRVEVTARGRKDAWTRIVEVVRPSNKRVAPPCSIVMLCGTCPWQAIEYEAQLTYKGDALRAALGARPELGDVTVSDPVGIAPSLGYRTKVQMPIAGHTGSLLAGFYAPRSHAFIAARECVVQHPLAEAVRTEVIRLLNRHDIAPYEENTHTGVLRTILVRVAEGTGQVGVVLVVRDFEAVDWTKMVADLIAVPNLTGVWVNENTEQTNAVLGPRTVHISGARRLQDKIAGIPMLRAPTAFFQTNHRAAELLVGILRDTVKGGKDLVDLYSGGGLFAAALADRFETLHLIESNADAITAATATLDAMGITKAQVHKGTAEEQLPRLTDQLDSVDAMIVDPPRAGMSEEVVAAVLAMAPKQLVYVSCRPKSLARDLARLAERYVVEEVRAVDMFPHTPHVEAVGLLRLRSADKTSTRS